MEESILQYSHKLFSDIYRNASENSSESNNKNELVKVLPSPKPTEQEKDFQKTSVCQFIEHPWQLKLLNSDKHHYNDFIKLSLAEKMRFKQIMIRIRKILNEGKPPNVVVCIGSAKFHCHMMVLQAYSPLLTEFLTNELTLVLPKNKITAHAFANIYRWMIEDKPILQGRTIMEVFIGAIFLKMNSLINYCWHIFDNRELFEEDSAFMLYSVTKSYKCEYEHFKKLQLLLLTRVNKFFLVLITSSEFIKMELKELCILLNSNLIGVHDEIEVLMAAVRWLDYDWINREKHWMDVMKCVRFGLLPPWLVVALQRNSMCKFLERIFSHPKMKQILSDALSYCQVMMYYGTETATLKTFNLNIYNERHWVVDRFNSDYYDEFMMQMKKCVSYKHFENFLTYIQRRAVGFWQTLKFKDAHKIPQLRCTDEK